MSEFRPEYNPENTFVALESERPMKHVEPPPELAKVLEELDSSSHFDD